ncbi:MAG: hypothetical protein H0X25_12780 [Acidobacteriales bacterium]|nr:hypothetical protein [Terriglobales bacterium]
MRTISGQKRYYDGLRLRNGTSVRKNCPTQANSGLEWATSLIHAADLAQKAAKNAGKNRVTLQMVNAQTADSGA